VFQLLPLPTVLDDCGRTGLDNEIGIDLNDLAAVQCEISLLLFL
jgi:hypothetical protein